MRAVLTIRQRIPFAGRALAGSAVVLGLLALAGCGSATVQSASPLRNVPTSQGKQTLRYLDPAFSQITTTSNLAYGRAPGRGGSPQTLTLDLYQPAGDTVARRPAIVWIHGGSFCCGSDTSGPSAELAEKFAYLGYVTVSIDYRLLAPSACVVEQGALTQSCEADATAARDDAQAAVRWLRAHAARYRIDPTRIGVAGDSAGAVTATLVGLNAPGTGDGGNPGYGSDVRAFMSLSGGLPSGRLGSTGPSSGSAAGLLFSGTADPTVPHQWSIGTTSALLQQKVPAVLVSLAGAGHDPYLQFESQIDQETDYFFYIFMDGAHAQGSPADAAALFAPELTTLTREAPALARAITLEQARR